MRSLTLSCLALTFCLALPAAAPAAEAPLRLDDLRAAINGRRAEIGIPMDSAAKRLARDLDKALSAIDRESAQRSRRRELQAARRAVRPLERSAGDEAAVMAALDEVVMAYETLLRADVEALQDILARDVAADTVRRRVFKRTRRASRKFQRAESEPRRAKRLRLFVVVDRALSILPDLVGDPVDPGDPGGGGTGGGGGGGGSGGGDPPDIGRTITWVIDTMAIAAAGTGFDLDGDGTIDNSLANMQAAVGPLNGGAPIDGFIAQNINRGSRITVLQLWGVHDLTTDSEVFLGMLEPTDTDNDATDNLNGQEQFVALAGTLDGDEHAVTNATAALTNGAYVTTLPQSFTNPVINTGFGLGTSFRIRGVVSETRNDGTLGVIFSPTDVALLVNAMLPPMNAHLAPGIVAGLLDVDTTGNGIADSMSAAFDFTSVRCTVAPPAPR